MRESDVVVGLSAYGSGWVWFGSQEEAERCGARQISPATAEEAACAARILEADRRNMPKELLGKMMTEFLAKRGEPAAPVRIKDGTP